MKNALYRKTIRSANESESGEEPVLLTLTEEVNGLVIWLEYGDMFVTAVPLAVLRDYQRDAAIELAVLLGKAKAPELLRDAQHIVDAMFSNN